MSRISPPRRGRSARAGAPAAVRTAAAALALALLFGLAPLAGATGPDDPSASAAPDAAAAAGPPPLPVTIGFHVNDVRGVEMRAQQFLADFYLWMRYPIPEGATGAAEAEERAKEIEKLDFVNGTILSREELDRKRVGAEQYVCWRVVGEFHFAARLEDYPFDTQRLEILVEHPSLEADALVYADDRASYERSGAPPEMAGVREGLDIAEFTLRHVERTTETARYRTDFGDPERPTGASLYSRFVLRMRFARDFRPYFAKIVIPLIVILAMAYLAFFIPAKEIQSASGLVVTALLSTIAFNVAVSQNLPEVGYLVVSDKFFIATYFLLLFALAETVLTYKWDDEGHVEFAQRWDRVGVIAFPALILVVFGYLLAQALRTHG